MKDENWKEYIKKSRDEYCRIRFVTCPAFGGERVYFNKYGFNHLIRKGEDVRSHAEQMKRISLIGEAVRIIKTTTCVGDTRLSERTNVIRGLISTARFWSLVDVYENKKIS